MYRKINYFDFPNHLMWTIYRHLQAVHDKAWDRFAGLHLGDGPLHSEALPFLVRPFCTTFLSHTGLTAGPGTCWLPSPQGPGVAACCTHPQDSGAGPGGSSHLGITALGPGRSSLPTSHHPSWPRGSSSSHHHFFYVPSKGRLPVSVLYSAPKYYTSS